MSAPFDANPYAAPAAPVVTPAVAQADMDDSSLVDPAACAGFGVRAGARLIDMTLSSAAGFVGGLLAAVIATAMVASGRLDAGWAARLRQGDSFLMNILIGSVAALACHIVSESMGGATFGKLVLGLRVVNLKGGPIGVGAAFKRSLAYFVDSFFFGLPAYNAMTASPRRQRIGDNWADTVVVRASMVPAESLKPMSVAFVGALAGFLIEMVALVVNVVAKL